MQFQGDADLLSLEIDASVPQWVTRPKQQFEAELRRRGLPHQGTKPELIERIQDHNDWICTPEGILEAYNRKLDLYRKQALKEVISFERFPKFAPEIRLMIWEYSLPGPRILSAGSRSQGNEIFFHEKDNPSNPAALSTCRESRGVALKRYNLLFGTTNVYADISGGDILHFDDTWTACLFHHDNDVLPWQVKWLRGSTVLSPSAKADMGNITSLALPFSIWIGYKLADSVATLQAHLKMFPALRKLFLVVDENIDHWGLPSSRFLTDRLSDGQHDEIKSDCAASTRKAFLESKWTEEEVKRGIPEVLIVSIDVATHIPGYSSGCEYAEPFVSAFAVTISEFTDFDNSTIRNSPPNPTAFQSSPSHAFALVASLSCEAKKHAVYSRILQGGPMAILQQLVVQP